MDGESEPIFESSLPPEAKLERAREELLDLSARNRLLNIPRSAKSARTLEIVDEQGGEVFRLLVREGRAFTFLAGRKAPAEASEETDGEEVAELAQPEDDTVDARGVLNRHADTKLQTRLTPAGLQKRLLDLYSDARTLEEEQGVNILFLAVGTLKWVDPKAEHPRHAPLILVPVALERGSAGEKFKLKVRAEDPAPNLSLEAYLNRIQGLKLPMFEAGDDFDPGSYMAAVAEAVAGKPGWEVAPDAMVLGFFSFAKFLMYRDLDPAVWPARARITEQRLVRPLLADGFSVPDDLLPDDGDLDASLSPAEMMHIVDSDSSQTLAVHEVRRGRDLVIQGPPGTGKSQTIANVIASAVADGKTVLFVAEKMAALEVVKRRLDATGVGEACLELHSNKANKRALIEELRRTWELGSPKGDGASSLNTRLVDARDRLNAHAARMHAPHPKAGLTPFQVIGHLTRLRQDGRRPNDMRLQEPESWSADAFAERHKLLGELVERVEEIGTPAENIWRDVRLETVTRPEVERLEHRIADLAARLEAIRTEGAALAAAVDAPAPTTFADLEPLSKRAARMAEAPPLSAAAFEAGEWANRSAEIDRLLGAGKRLAELAARVELDARPSAWTAETGAYRDALAGLPADLGLDALDRLGAIVEQTPALLSEAERLSTLLGREPPRTTAAIDHLVRLAETVASAPEAGPEVFGAHLWNDGVERASDLAGAVEALQAARAAVGDRLTDAAWSTDLRAARGVLAAHGSGFFKIFSGEWRAADRSVRAVLTDPKTPLDAKLPLLDALARGQAALALIGQEDGFGKAAFGADWRGERSSASKLRALTDWMASLGALGAEPRLILARAPDRRGVDDQAARVRPLLEAVSPVLHQGVADLRGAPALEGVLPDHGPVDLLRLRERLAPIQAADAASRDILVQTPARLADRLRLLAAVSEAQAKLRQVEDGAVLGAAALGDAWRGRDSDWPALAEAAAWMRRNPELRAAAARLDDRGARAARAALLAAEQEAFERDHARVLADLMIDPASNPSAVALPSTPAREIAARLAAWLANMEPLFKWVNYRGRAEEGRRSGLNDVVDRLHDGRLPPAEILPAFEMSYYEALYADQGRADPQLARFDGGLHDRLVREFRDLDLQRIAASRLEVVRAHHRRIPPVNGGAVGPLGVLRGEIARRRGHMAIRKLMENAAPAVQALKPVFMMSPLSVAQFLPPGKLEFDLLVMDEASQIQPVDALGAIARCRQVVVVGDPKQLPPTAFFSKMVGAADDDDEADGAKVADIESILGLFEARGLPRRMLRWHYRSRHQSLIAVSNTQFYENKLFIVPSPYTREAGMGLVFHHVADGIFETATTRTNPVEAKVVAKAVVEHARRHPELSLGVAAFSAAQRRAIQDQLEILRRGLSPEVESFFQSHPSEPFFVKNLENVQGDERDVILISVGYGPTAPGQKPPMRFGPVGQQGGERRLNVLISRAKRRCEVFSSLTDEDIDPDFACGRPGVFAFRLFLHFARTGRLTMAENTGRDTHSVFEEQVAKALQARGYQVHRNVGLAGFFIDIAVADPEQPGRYLLGVECDGAAYRGARSARDRDRLRQSVLEDHGWSIHRIWSTDWFQRPKEQLERLVAAVETAKAEQAARRASRPRAVPIEITTVERETVTEIGLTPVQAIGAPLYEEAKLIRPANGVTELHLTPTGVLAALVEQLVAVEGPVHLDEVVNRIRDAWGLKRAGARIQQAVERAAAVAVRQGRIVQDRLFLAKPGAKAAVRDRSQVLSSTLRKPETLPPAEIHEAVLAIVGANYGATVDQITMSAARVFGFKATSGQLRSVIQAVVDHALRARELVEQDGNLIPGPAAPVALAASHPDAALTELVAQGEHETLEFKQSARWDIDRNCKSDKIEHIVVKTVAAFANKEGGALLIGVKDDGTPVGLDPDLATVAGSLDKYELFLTNLFVNHFGQAFKASKIRVTFPFLADVRLCRVDVRPAPEGVWVKLPDRAGQIGERFFARSGNSSQELSPSQAQQYLRTRLA